MMRHYLFIKHFRVFSTTKIRIPFEIKFKIEFMHISLQRDPLEFSKLKYNTTYVLRVPRSSPNSVLNDSRNVFTFTTPKCENFRKSFPKLQIKCGD